MLLHQKHKNTKVPAFDHPVWTPRPTPRSLLRRRTVAPASSGASVNSVARGAFDGRAAVAPADAPPPPPPVAVEAPPAPRPKDIAAFLAALELPQYAGGFVANGVDFLAIPALERDDWVELGVPIGHRARIVKEHKALHPELW